MEELIKYNLVLELRPGDYNVIEINRIPNLNYNVSNDIASIDTFTAKYSESDLKKIVEDNNLVEMEYLKGNFKIISNLKHNLPILNKEKFEIIEELKNSNEELEKPLKDKLYGYYKKVISNIIDGNELLDLLKNFKNALQTNNNHEILRLISEIPYAKSRTIYFMLSEELLKRKNDRIRKLEKLDDVA